MRTKRQSDRNLSAWTDHCRELLRGLVWTLVLAASMVAAPVAMSEPAARVDDEFLIRRWETDDGFPDSSALAMVQDAQGYLWIGTFRGLARFDGVSFRVFEPSNTPELPDQGVVSLHIDRSGRLWAGTMGGIATLEGGTWTRRTEEPVDGMVVRAFAERGNGDMLITDFTGRVVEQSGGRFRRLPDPPGMTSRGYLGVANEQGRWFVAQTWFIGEWDGEKWVELVPTPKDRSAEVSCAASRDGGVWVLVDQELSKLRHGAVVSRIQLQDRPGGLWQLYEDRFGNVWISTYDNGLWMVDPARRARHWGADELGQASMRFAFEDREATIWAGSSGGGLSRFTRRRFDVMEHEQSGALPAVTSVAAAPDGSVWAATYGLGVFRIVDRKMDRVALFDEQHGAVTFAQSVLVDRRGRVWIGTYEGRVCVVDGGSQRWIDEGLATRNVTSLMEDSRGRMWMCGKRGIAVHEEGVGVARFGAQDGLTDGEFGCLAEDDAGNIWTSDGARVYRQSGARFEEVLGPVGKSISGVVTLRRGTGGSMWLGTSRQGLWRWKGGVLAPVRAEAWPSEGVYGIVEDGDGYWWMRTERGVARASAVELDASVDGRGVVTRVALFDRRDGLATSDCAANRQPSMCRDASGRVWLATMKGVCVVDPGTLHLNQTPAPSVIQELSYAPAAGEGERRRVSIDGSATVAIPAGSRRVEIRYTGLSFVSPERVRFQVRLNSAEQWADAGTHRTAYYDELSPGAYEFQVRAANDDGLWGPIASVGFTIAPEVWETAWFRVLGGVLMVGVSVSLTWWLLHSRNVRISEQMELKQHRQEMIHLTRVNMLGELSGAMAHELSQPLTAILSNAQAAQRFIAQGQAQMGEVDEILADIVKENRRAGEIILRLRKLLKKGEVVRQVLDLDQIIADAVRLVRSELVNHNVGVAIDVSPGVPTVWGDRVQIEQVMLNLITNAIDAMAAGDTADSRSLLVRCRRAEDGGAQVSVIDSGPGIDPSQIGRMFEPFVTTKRSGMGLGLAICRTIVSAHGGRIWAESDVDRGATVHFTIPTSKERA